MFLEIAVVKLALIACLLTISSSYTLNNFKQNSFIKLNALDFKVSSGVGVSASLLRDLKLTDFTGNNRKVSEIISPNGKGVVIFLRHLGRILNTTSYIINYIKDDMI
jgi:hypothetical protein